jgi:hypothetical protein
MKQMKFMLKRMNEGRVDQSEAPPASSSNCNFKEEGGRGEGLIRWTRDGSFSCPVLNAVLNAQVKSDINTGISFTFRSLEEYRLEFVCDDCYAFLSYWVQKSLHIGNVCGLFPYFFLTGSTAPWDPRLYFSVS